MYNPYQDITSAQIADGYTLLEQMYLEKAFEAGARGNVEMHDDVLRWAEKARNLAAHWRTQE